MHNGDTLALHRVDAGGRRVEDYVDEAIVKQVDLVNVEDTAVGLGLGDRRLFNP